MKNIRIVVTDNRTIVVKADTERHGKNAILFEGRKFMECCDYIRRTAGKNHFQLKAWSVVEQFTDTDGLTLPSIMSVVFKEESA